MQSRLWRAGMRPINALVDITNYVMLATGQPTHAFDSDNIQGHIIVRRAQEGEKLLLLNGKDLSSPPTIWSLPTMPVWWRWRASWAAPGFHPAHHPQGHSGGSQLQRRRRSPDGPALR